jgi:hypothetical protein
VYGSSLLNTGVTVPLALLRWSRLMKVPGGRESSTYVIGAEHAETLSEASLAVALNVVFESFGT